jgi:adenine-specific DNA-methyltransferase
LCDEIFGRKNRRSIITFKQSSVSGPKSKNPGIVTTSNYIVWYSASRDRWSPNRAYKKISRDPRYSKYILNIEECYSLWQIDSLNSVFAKANGILQKGLKKTFGDKLEGELEKFVLSSPRRIIRTATVKDKDVNETAREALHASRRSSGVFRAEREGKEDYCFIGGEQLLFYSNKVQPLDGEYVSAEALSNIWDDLLSNNLHKEGGVTFPKGKKPEALIKRILELSTKPGDIVLDSFLGSGTTAAVAHKMRRRWIGIELGEQCHTHVVPRLKKVVSGID